MAVIISEHARKEIANEDITEEEVYWCLEHGEPEIKQIVKQEMRYGKKLALKDKTLMVIYTFRGEETRIITCYTIRRKKWPRP